MARSRWTTAAAMVCVAVGVYLGLSALDVGAGAPSAKGGSAAPEPAPLAIYTPEAPHVLSSLAPYRGALSRPPSDDLVLASAAFLQPIAQYRSYSQAQLVRMRRQIATLRAALAANDRPRAQAAWRDAYSSYLRLGAVYLSGAAAALNREIDGTAGGLEGGVANPGFSGLHRIEYGLWTATAPRMLLGWTARLAAGVARLERALPDVAITPLEYATRAHEILEDAVRDLLSGADVPWSGEGVLATQAGLQATEEVLSTLRPIIPKDTRVTQIVAIELAALRSALASIAAAHGGRLPPNGQLTQDQSELLDGTLGGALEALAQVPGALETEPLPHVPQIPSRDARIDP